MRLRRILPALLLVLPAGAVAACGSAPDLCDKMDEPGGEQTGATVVLIDVTGSAHDGRSAPDYAEALGTYLDQAITRGDLVSIGSFDGSASTVRWTSQNKLTLLNANKERNRELQRGKYKSCLKEDAKRAAAEKPKVAGTDIAGAINVAAESASAPGPDTVVVATDGLSNTGCLSLASPSAGRSRWIDDLVGKCPDQPGWPAKLAGKNLIMVGVGQPADSETLPSTGGVEFVQALWQRTCLAARALSCDISSVPIAHGGGATDSGQTDTPVTFVPDAGPPAISPGPVVNLSSEELFTVDSDVLQDGAAGRLSDLADQIGLRDPVSIEVIGHTDSRSSVAHNLDLSKRRAARVSDVLREAGLSQVTSDGVGEQHPLCTTTKLPDGSWNEPCLQRDRRVEIVVKLKEGPA